MDPYERSKIGDALKPVIFKQGDYVVREVSNQSRYKEGGRD